MYQNVAIIGSSGGIGSELCRQIQSKYNPDNIFEFSRSGEWAINESTKINVDITDEASIQTAVNKIPEDIKFDLVFVATGRLHDDVNQIMPEKALSQLDGNNMIETMWINAIGPSLIAKELVPKLRRDDKSIFAALTARVGSISDNHLGGWYGYRAAKSALNMMLKSISIETKRRNKRAIIVGIHPGTVDTNLSKPFQKNIKPEKIFTSQFSVSKILEILEQLNESHSGKLFAWDGAEIHP